MAKFMKEFFLILGPNVLFCYVHPLVETLGSAAIKSRLDPLSNVTVTLTPFQSENRGIVQETLSTIFTILVILFQVNLLTNRNPD